MTNTYHIPVMLSETLNALQIKEGGVYADLTFGGGGHSKGILNSSKHIQLLAFDSDKEAEHNASQLITELKLCSKTFRFYRTNFKYVCNFVKYAKHKKIDGILADLGVSSHQFDEGSRGFSYRKNARPDMRMNQSATKDASMVINEYSQDKLTQIFRLYGELKKARFMASLIAEARTHKPIETLEELNAAVQKALPRYNEYKVLSKLYQAIRIEVNDEMKSLERMLECAPKILKPGGRLVVLTYHSLEDRMVKNFINSGNVGGEMKADIYGNTKRPFDRVKPKYQLPTEAEIKNNSRAASAKLRVAEKRAENGS